MNIVENIFEVLNEHTDYAVARNHKGLPQNCASRDIDILISRKKYNEIKNKLLFVAQTSGYKVLLVSQSDRFDSIFFQNGGSIIQFDFFFGASAFGILMLTAEEILVEKQFDGNVYYLPLYMQFLDKFLFNRMVGQNYPEKYAHIRKQLTHTEEDRVNKVLKTVWGTEFGNLENAENATAKELRRAALKSSKYRYGINQFKQKVQYYSLTINNMLLPRGLFLSFTGPDGVGKTTILNIIEDTYKLVWSGDATQVRHFRPDAIPRLALLLHRAGVVKSIDEDYDKPHRGKNSGTLGSLIRLFYYIADYQIGYWRKIFPRKFRRQVTIYDRYYSDIVIDSERSNIKLPYKIIYCLGKLISQPEYPLLVTADEEVILSRKQELTKEEIHQIQEIISWMAKTNKKFIQIENNGTAEETAATIMEEILRKQNKKYKKYFQR